MPEYIDREKAVDTLLTEMCMTGHQSRAINAIRMIEKEDVAPVVHGQWLKITRALVDSTGFCSVCGEEAVWRNGYPYLRCPTCGAKMDGGNNETD